MKRNLLFLLTLLVWIRSDAQSLKKYHLVISDTMVNYSGKTRMAMAINGKIPGPELHFTEGDTAVISIENRMHHETSIHWHGLLLPNEQDGVPYLTTAPVKAMGNHEYRFVIRQSGTYWYHSHTMLQEQSGIYGAFIISKREKDSLPEHTVLLSDWSDEDPHQIERSLHGATDWYAIKKGAVQSYTEAARKKHLGTKFVNEFKRMHAMDVSDVYYESMLANGKLKDSVPQYKKGDRIRLRVINGSSSTYFWLHYAGGKITVVASDGVDVEPVEVDRLIVGVSETYDVVVSIPEEGSYEFAATAEDRSNGTSLWLGSGEARPAEQLPRLKYFEGMKMMNDMMTVGGKMKDMGMNMGLQQMDMNIVMYPEISGYDDRPEGTAPAPSVPVTLNYAMLKSPVRTTLPAGPVRELHFELTGNMNRYVWTVNNKTISESDKILIEGGENIRIVVTNNSMMRHPMHLHGHFFRLLNGQGDYSPLKNVMDILPMETDTIEFHASEGYGDWYFHCHILYHMMAGMGRIFTYKDSPPNPQIADPEKALRMVYHDDRRFYTTAEIALESNGSDGEITHANTRWFLQAEWRLGINNRKGFETEAHVGRFLGANQFAMVYTGWDLRYRKGGHDEENIFGYSNTKDQRSVLCLGFRYVLPWFITTDVRLDSDGEVRMQLKREDIPLSKRVRLWGMINSDLEYSAGARYIFTKYLSLSSHYDSDMGLGGGLTITY
ncbi:MAG: multicopper oxidase domain-containing protein [Bacteroidia bacterium]|nr:multicopper oxidase domain-containing protein [Bacteroidia bacterium]